MKIFWILLRFANQLDKFYIDHFDSMLMSDHYKYTSYMGKTKSICDFASTWNPFIHRIASRLDIVLYKISTCFTRLLFGDLPTICYFFDCVRKITTALLKSSTSRICVHMGSLAFDYRSCGDPLSIDTPAPRTFSQSNSLLELGQSLIWLSLPPELFRKTNLC